MQEFQLHSEQRTQLIDITPQVNDAVAASGLREGLCNIFAPHTTAAVIVSENWDPDVSADLLGRLQAIIPQEAGYRHGEGNSQAHIVSAILGASLNIPVIEGRLALGQWQGVMFVEFDGPRVRHFRVSVIPEAAS